MKNRDRRRGTLHNGPNKKKAKDKRKKTKEERRQRTKEKGAKHPEEGRQRPAFRCLRVAASRAARRHPERFMHVGGYRRKQRDTRAYGGGGQDALPAERQSWSDLVLAAGLARRRRALVHADLGREAAHAHNAREVPHTRQHAVNDRDVRPDRRFRSQL